MEKEKKGERTFNLKLTSFIFVGFSVFISYSRRRGREKIKTPSVLL